ncbi:MAG TPA: protein tyrosine phosphatase family protein [Trichocoleus sp.]
MTAEPLLSIYNFLPISDAIATAGQPTEAQFEAVQQSGYEVVINLAMPTARNALPNEQARVESLGMTYIPIPVVWENPTQADLEQFFEAMAVHQGKKVFVHCAANMRVSVFMYLYRRLRLGLDEAKARPDLERIWQPNPTWQQFIEQATSPTDS